MENTNLLYPETDEQGNIICQVCGKSYLRIMSTHLNLHNMTFDEYKMKYGTRVSSTTTRPGRKYADTGLFDDKFDVKDPTPSAIDISDDLGIKENILKDIERATTPPTEETIIEELNPEPPEPIIKEIPNLVNIKRKADDPITRNKNRILDQLAKHFPNIQKDYMIQEFDKTGNRLLFEFISDFTDPILKVTVEFPKTFWHNRSMYDNRRIQKLEAYGWKVIEINKTAPTPEDIDEEIKKNF